MAEKVLIRRLHTGVPGFDAVLGGGLPEFSFNLIAGAPGSGKTTLAQQIMFTLATPERPALFFTILGEPAVKMLRYQQQFTFFDLDKVNDSVRFINLAEEAVRGGLDDVLGRIVSEVEMASPGVVIVDSFRTVANAGIAERKSGDLQHFVQRLGIQLTGWEATTFLIGEYAESAIDPNPIFTVADSVIWLFQTTDRNSVVRKMQITKMRGQSPIPGLHTFRITDGGLRIFPRLILEGDETEKEKTTVRPDRPQRDRLSSGSTGLDEMLGGGIPEGYSVLVSGPSGSGKSVLAAQFMEEGVRRGETGVVAVFEKRPNEKARTGPASDAFSRLLGTQKVTVIQSRPLDLSIDETLFEVREAVHRLNARRLVIDSLSGFELALAPTFREDFRESLYRMVAVLTQMGVTVMMTAELEDSYTALRFSPHDTAFLTDAIIMQRYVELHGELKRIIGVVKVRGSAHSSRLHMYDVGHDGLTIGEPVVGYDSLLSGHPVDKRKPTNG